MTKEEKKDLDDLIIYIRDNILYYSNTKKTPPLLKKKINSIALDENNNFIYTYRMILYSFMINKSKIEYAFNTKTFANEKHKINYMFVIVANSLNDIKNRVLEKERQKELSENNLYNAQYLSDNNVLYGSSKYTKKTVELRRDKVEDLW